MVYIYSIHAWTPGALVIGPVAVILIQLYGPQVELARLY